MSQENGFLSRWSRRKLDANGPGPDPSQPDAVAGEPAHREDEPELPPEELAELPKIEDLRAESDIGPFLRKGVPALLRKAALRRMWELDPAIRDYVGDARDYAYDWNVIGGVPGTGPLLPTDDVGATLARMFRGNSADEAHPDSGPEASSAPSMSEEKGSAADQQRSIGQRGAGPEPVPLPSPEADEPVPIPAAIPTPKPASPRRHGGAVPV